MKTIQKYLTDYFGIIIGIVISFNDMGLGIVIGLIVTFVITVVKFSSKEKDLGKWLLDNITTVLIAMSLSFSMIQIVDLSIAEVGFGAGVGIVMVSLKYLALSVGEGLGIVGPRTFLNGLATAKKYFFKSFLLMLVGIFLTLFSPLCTWLMILIRVTNVELFPQIELNEMWKLNPEVQQAIVEYINEKGIGDEDFTNEQGQTLFSVKNKTANFTLNMENLPLVWIIESIFGITPNVRIPIGGEVLGSLSLIIISPILNFINSIYAYYKKLPEETEESKKKREAKEEKDKKKKEEEDKKKDEKK